MIESCISKHFLQVGDQGQGFHTKCVSCRNPRSSQQSRGSAPYRAKEARKGGQEAQAIKEQKLEEYNRRADDYEREAVWNEIGGNSTDRALAAYVERGYTSRPLLA